MIFLILLDANMKYLKKLLFCLLLLISHDSLSAQTVNNGEDIMRPLNRFDARFKHQEGAQNVFGRDYILTLRTDWVFPLPKEWQITLRCDVPYEWFYCQSHQCRNFCENTNRFGDTLIESFIVAPTYRNWTIGLGNRFVFPTAGPNLLVGDGKYELSPSFGVKYDFTPWYPRGAYLILLTRYNFDYTGYKSATHISKVFIQPMFNMNFAHGWFINSSPELIYNCMIRRWFIPIDLMIGKMITPKMVVSFEYSAALLNAFPQYKQQYELRVGLFF